jgi:hypothetical protein
MLEHEDFGTPEAVLRYIQERSDDIEKVVIPQTPTILIHDPKDPSGEISEVAAGLVIHLVSGQLKIIHPETAPLILNDGILHRMRIRIELAR